MTPRPPAAQNGPSEGAPPWNARLLKFWLWLSLLYAALLIGASAYLAILAYREDPSFGLIAAAAAIYILPLGAVLPLLALLIGWIIVKIVEAFGTPSRHKKLHR